MPRWLDVLTSFIATLLRPGAGAFVRKQTAPPPALPLQLYEFEACPFCRKVREFLTVLDLDAEIFPCPRGGSRFRSEVQRRGGKLQFPFLVDPNTGTELFESAQILHYLATHYGDGKIPLSLRLGPLTILPASLGAALRYPKGARATPSRRPELPLHLYSYEASPYSRLVRETLCELELPYHLHNVGHGSRQRPALRALAGKLQVPYLVDPNTQTAMFESADIIAYLRKTYAG